MELPSVKNLKVDGKKVLLRTDYDIPTSGDTTRIEKSLPTIKYLLEKKAKVVIISHLGRPGGKIVPELSLEPIAQKLKELLNSKLKTQNSKPQLKTQNFPSFTITKDIILLENLRFYPREEANDLDFAEKLASLADFYINDAFACSHRKHASIVGVPKFLPSVFGFSFIKEMITLNKVRNQPKGSVVLILGGAKEDKLEKIEKLAKWADWVLIGGKLPKLIANYQITKLQIKNKLIIAKLNPEGKDISQESIDEFKKIIHQGRTVVWAGPMGVFEEEKFAAGTREIAQAIAKSGAFSVVGGGDTEAALTKLGFDGKMSYISSGGGAMLEYLANGTLPGIEAITNKNF